MIDEHLRRRMRHGEATWADLARVGLASVFTFDGSGYGSGRGNGSGRGSGSGNGSGYGRGGGGYGNGDGYGSGDGSGSGRGYGSGYGRGDGSGSGDGYGSGSGDGYGSGSGSMEALVRHTDIIPVGTPVVARSWVSGVFAGRLFAGEGGTVALTDHRWLRSWTTAGKGSIYDLVTSSDVPNDRGPRTAEVIVLQQCDVLVISEAALERLCG